VAIPQALRKPPITEAVFDLKATLPTGVSTRGIIVGADLKAEYPKREAIVQFESGIELQANPPAAVTHMLKQEEHGFRLISQDGDRVAQFKRDGFALSWLNRYPGWEVAFEEAMRLWNLYTERLSPVSVTRLAVRTINRLELPFPMRDLRDYLAAAPASPEDLPIANFVTRVVIPNPEAPGMYATVSQAALDSVDPNTFAMILDIDAFVQKEHPPRREEIEQSFRVLRKFKNRVFFSSVTDQTVRLYE